MESDSPVNLAPSAPTRRMRTVPAYLVSRLISSYFGYLLVMGVLVLLVPNFEGAFKDESFRLQPPTTTVWLLNASRICRVYYLWALLIPVPALWAVANFNIPKKKLRRGIRLFAFLLVAAFLIFTLLALFLPMTHLLQPTTRATQQ